jgi:hypothetical protein
MLYCALKNIRNASLFPRDPKRITPWNDYSQIFLIIISLKKLANKKKSILVQSYNLPL